MSRGWIAAAIAALAAVGVGAVLVFGVLGGDSETDADADPPSTASEAIATTSTVVIPTTRAQTTAMTVGEDPLCLAIEEMTTASAGHLPVEGPEDLEAVRTASVTFYTEAVGLVEGPQKTAFEEVLSYEEALFAWSEANDWEPTRSLEDLTDNPPPTPPAEAFATVTQVFEDRCGVVPVRE